LNPHQEVTGVSTQVVSPFSQMGVLEKEHGGDVNLGAGDLAVTAGWGYLNASGAIMPGGGRVEPRPFTALEAQPFSEADFELLEGETRNIHLNDSVYWRNIPLAAWKYSAGERWPCRARWASDLDL
jgi:hypothetical protein